MLQRLNTWSKVAPGESLLFVRVDISLYAIRITHALQLVVGFLPMVRDLLDLPSRPANGRMRSAVAKKLLYY